MGDLDDQLRRLADRRAARTPATTSAGVTAAPTGPRGRLPVWIAAAAVLAALAGSAVWLADQNDENGTDVAATSTTTVPSVSTTTDPGPAATMSVSADDYGVRLEIPATWSAIEPGRTWGGDDGFVAVDVTPGAGLAEAVEGVVASGGFGDTATVAVTTVGGRPARLIAGNEATVGSELGDFVAGGVVVELPGPIMVRDESWTVLAISGDLVHLATVLDSLEWIDSTTPADRPDPVRAEIDAVDPTVAYDLAVGTDVGIELRRTFTDDVDVLVGPATELAFLVDGWLISQDEPQGPVRAGRTTFPDELDLGEGEIRLLDAAIVDGAASALVTRRTGTTPEDTTERLLLVGVEDRSVTDLGVVGGWESGLDDGRFADGAIALRKSAEGFTWIAALDYSGTELWATPETFDATLRMTVLSDTVLALNPGWAADGAAPIFATRRFELRSGELMENVSTRLTPVDGVALDEVFCRRLVMWPAPSCGQSSGPPVQIDFYTRTIAPLLGPVSAGTPTAVDATVSTTFPPSAPREVPG